MSGDIIYYNIGKLGQEISFQCQNRDSSTLWPTRDSPATYMQGVGESKFKRAAPEKSPPGKFHNTPLNVI